MAEADLATRARELKALHGDGDAPVRGGVSRFAEQMKDLVEERLRESNQDADVERTTYFNHSAIPDFVVKWGKSKYPRGVYLRGSYAAIVAARDVRINRNDDPIFMSLDDDQNFKLGGVDFGRAGIAEVVSDANSTLVTDINAFSAATEPREGGDVSPLQDLVRANFVRGGRGLFDGEQVEQIVHEFDRADGRSLSDEISTLFTEQAQGEFKRAATLIDLARPEGQGGGLDVAHLLRGRLTYQEIRTLLPWIMSHSSAPVGAPFWRLLGSLLDLELLEHEASALRDVDLTALVESNLDVFAATRAYAGLNVDPDDADEGDPSLDANWRMVGATLTRIQGPAAVRFAHLGTRLRSSGSFSAPRWSTLSGRVGGYTLSGAGVYGVDEAIRVDSRRGRSIHEYLNAAIPETAADDFFVDDITVRLESAGSEGEDREVRVDFKSRLVVPNAETALGPMIELIGLLDELNPRLGDSPAVE